MSFTGSLSAQLRYTVPGPGVAAPSFAVSSIVYTASNAGFIDVLEATADATSFDIPFGAVDEVKCILIQNNTDQQLNVSVNGSTDVFSLPAGGLCVPLCSATASLDEPLVSVSVTTTAIVAADGTIAYVVLGDDPTP